MVFAAYRKDDFADADGYLVQLGMVLERYPDAIIREATSPISGIQRSCKFPPSIAEIAEFCEELKRRATYADEWAERSRRQLDERRDYEEQCKAEALEHRQRVVQRIKSDLAQHGMHILQTDGDKLARKSSGFRQFTADELQRIYARQTGDAAE